MAKDKDNQKKPDGAEAGTRPEGKGKPEGREAKGRVAPKAGGAGKHKFSEAVIAEASKVSGPPRLKALYDQKIRGELAGKFGIKNPMAQPRLQKITINVNMGRHLDGAKIPPNVKTTVLDTIQKVSGQKPIVQKAKKSVANFKVRAGVETSAMVTMRRERMWHFLDRLINLATPRIKDFRGLPRHSFDRQGNYSMGLQEQGVFPEINMAEAVFTHGMNINFTFSNSTPELSRFVLEQMGMPFAKEGEDFGKKDEKKKKKKKRTEGAAPAAA